MKCTYPLFSKGKMSRDCIKYIAMAAMFCNHFATVFLKGQTLLYEIFIDIGYFTAITMCYFLVEGFAYTHSRKKYGQRLFVFALISQIPFQIVTGYLALNMMFTLFTCFLILVVLEHVWNPQKRYLLIFLLFMATLFMDWGILAPAFVVMFAKCKDDRQKLMKVFGVCVTIFFVVNFMTKIEFYPHTADVFVYSAMSCIGMIASGIMISTYYQREKNNENRKCSKWFFYVFYPAHLLLLGVLRMTI